MSIREFEVTLLKAGVCRELVDAIIETKPPYINWDDLNPMTVKLMIDLALTWQAFQRN